MDVLTSTLLLPELRGGAPIHYAIMEGKEKQVLQLCIW